MNKLPTQSLGTIIYISHGGGPLPLLGDASHQELVEFFRQIPQYLKKPSVIIVFSAHWEENKPTIISASAPSLFYDYYGFPQKSYEIKYPVAGEPLLAKRAFELLEKHDFYPELNEQRGLDHGVFVPLKLTYPKADIPCIQISLIRGLDPSEHIRMGKALKELMRENILIIGSGFSFHNFKAFFTASTPEVQSMNASFEKWLTKALTDSSLTEDKRAEQLINWKQAPAAEFCHPREEHLIPLHVCYGIAESLAQKVFPLEIMGKKASAYLW
jgi:aromatic ring-opening dioxygenase catalytic subunit (LigB family)